MSMERRKKPVVGRPRPSRPMPHWMVAATAAGVRVGGDSPPVMPPPPPPPEDPEYEVIEVNTASYMNGPPRPPSIGAFRKGTGRHCDLCGGSTPAVRCDLCSGQIFCSSCDDMYHRHPKRQSHVRKVLEAHTIMRPPLPPRGEIGMAPVPPPRSRQKRAPTLFRLPSTGGILSALGKERQQDPGQQRREFSLSEKMGSLRKMMGSRPLPPTPPPQQMMPPRSSLSGQSPHQPMVSPTGSGSKFHTMREGSSSFRHNSDAQGRWRHPSIPNTPQSPMKSPGLNGHRGTSMGDLWDHGGMGNARESAFHRGSPPPSMERQVGGPSWQQPPNSDGRASPSPWGQNAFGDSATASLHRRRRSDLTPPWNGWQRGGMTASASVSDLQSGMVSWGGSNTAMQQAQSMAHLHHCPGCMISPGGHPWGIPMQDHWHCGMHGGGGPGPGGPSPGGWGGSLLQIWPHHHSPTVMVPPQAPSSEARHHMEEGGWNSWDDGGGGGKAGVTSDNSRAPEDEDEKTEPFVPNYPWSCEHCTFVNQPGIRVCSMCCKTVSADIEQGRRNGVETTQPRSKWADAESQRGDSEVFSNNMSSKGMQQDKRKNVEANNDDDNESSRDGSIVTAVQELEGHQWQSYSPRPQKNNEKSNQFRSIGKSPVPTTTTREGDERSSQFRRVSNSSVPMTSNRVNDDRHSQFRRISNSPVPMKSTGVGDERPSQVRRVSKSPVSVNSTGVGDDRSSHLRRMSNSPVHMTSAGVGDDRHQRRRASKSPVSMKSTGVGDDRPSHLRRVSKSPVSMTSTGVGDERPSQFRRINDSPIHMTSAGKGNDIHSHRSRVNRSPVSITSTGVGDDRPSQFRIISQSPTPMRSTGIGEDIHSQRGRVNRSPVSMTSTGVGDDRPSHFRRINRSPVPTISTGVGDDKPFHYRREAYSPITATMSTGMVDDRQMQLRRIDNSPLAKKSTASGGDEVVMKVSMAVGTSPPRPMKIEKQLLSKASSMASVGTSPPPQTIATQTYDNPTALTSSSSTRKKSADFGSQVSIGQEPPSVRQGSGGQYAGASRRMPRLRRTLSLNFNNKQRESTPNTFLRSQSRHSICGNSGDQSTPEPPAVPLRRRLHSSSTTSSEYYNPSGEADGEWSGADDERKEGDKVHGLELVRLLREAEQLQFTAEEVEVALKHCGNKVGGSGDRAKGPLAWLKANWLQMVDTVATLATNFGLERKENTVGTVSTAEAREALRKQGGDVWASVTHCVEARQRKYAELVSRGNFTREDIVSALSNSQGNIEIAFNELSKSQLKPFLMRIWGPPVSGTGDNESGNRAIQPDSRTSSAEEINHILEEARMPSTKPTTEVKEEKAATDNANLSDEEKSEPEENEELSTPSQQLSVNSEGHAEEEIAVEKTVGNSVGVAEDEVKDVRVPPIPNGDIVAGVMNKDNTDIDAGRSEEAKELEISPKETKKEELVQSGGNERMARQLLAIGHVSTYERAEVAAILVLEENIPLADALLAVQECTTVDAALSYLRQECLLCTGEYPMNQMVSMLTCVHRCCQDCARLYFTVQIRDRSIEDAVCPFCKEPNFPKKPVGMGVPDVDEEALHYYSNLDILLKAILDPKDHELFQRKLRDRTLANEANFKWCTKCSSGFISDPRQKRLVCPDCKSITCASCHRPWAKQHEGLSCERFAKWLEENDPATQAAGLARHLAESTEAMLSCPHCKCNFSLARGGCMHLTCPQCRHEFCSGCGQTFSMGTQCTVKKEEGQGEEAEEESSSVAVILARGNSGHPCARLGLHAHHPRDCLFYLRDMEPAQLQKLLEDNSIEFNSKNPQAAGEEGNPDNAKVEQKMKCRVQVQREGPTGLLDGFCEEDVPKDHAGLCRLHYIEYLVGVMRRAGLDPAPAFDHHEAIAELRRRNIAPPERPQGSSDEDYRKICVEMIQKMIPLKNTMPMKAQDK